ncbi:NifB/NifX family molybdenum-iron cluster-binding protein [Celerinatantimonas sp. YJH-8]|uniref:NifB/NifX family molybdenum-iron cluster-binding protein n=1 Tax=Celerinatantimonas sp. YJH-8 TaxID=3228714 RepID=UPI0038BE7D35
MIKVAFASLDGVHVDQHFGASEQLIIYSVKPGEADVDNIAQFSEAIMKGEHKNNALGYEVTRTDEDSMLQDNETEPSEQPEVLSEDKVIEKIEFIGECAAVYAASIGTSSIRRLMKAGIQPVIVDYGHDIVDLLNEVSFALVHGGLSWVDKAQAQHKSPERFANMLEQGWPTDESTERPFS